MKRTLLVYALMAATAALLGAQEGNQSNPYQGTSNPPPDNSTAAPAQQTAPRAKPRPGKPAYAAPAAQPAPPSYAAETVPDESAAVDDGTDNGIVQVAPPEYQNTTGPALNQRAAMADPDGDIVHPAPAPLGELPEGTTIRTRLIGSLSTGFSQPGEAFRAQVASDVVQDGQVLIPAGSVIDGKVVSVSSGHVGGHGSMRLRPDTVILPDGSRFRMYAQLSGAPGSKQRVGSEGLVTPGSRLKKDGIEYGGTVGAGAVTGAFLGGPGGALAGTIVGASLITVHLLVSHPQPRLENGTVLLFSLSEPLNLVRDTPRGN